MKIQAAVFPAKQERSQQRRTLAPRPHLLPRCLISGRFLVSVR